MGTANTHAPSNLWNTRGRTIVFFLAATSIACLLFDFYKLCSMRTFTLYVFGPAVAVLAVIACFDFVRGNKQLWRAVLLGTCAGLLAAVAYDIFRLPFVFAKEWHIASIVPPLQLFKVFPRFGAMILNEPIEQDHYSAAAQIIGWLYHFSNGATFGVMYIALIGTPTRKHWAWGIAMAVGLELGMLFTPYPGIFHIPVTATFVVVTLLAHGIFGVTVGKLCHSRGRDIVACPA